jgi:hypothetical protein
MSKKHFELLAEQIRLIENRDVRAQAAVAVSKACLEDNPNFSPCKFFEACGVI